MIDQRLAEFEAWIKTHCDYDDLDRSEMMLAFDAYQAALASPEVQALRKDADRYRAIRNAAVNGDEVFIGAAENYSLQNCADPANPTPDEFDAAIDAAMEKQK